MLQSERINDFEEALRIALLGFSANVHHATVGIVESYDATRGLCRVQVAIEAQVSNPAGQTSSVQIDLLSDVPVIYMGGGEFVTTYPIQAGDEALVIFAERCIDGWFQSGGVQGQGELRMHDVSDGFALIGPRSLARLIPNVSTTTAQFRTMDGTAYYELASGGVANIVAPGGIKITGPVTIDGDVAVTGEVTASEEGTFNNIPVSTHLHTGVQSGGSETGGPIA